MSLYIVTATLNGLDHTKFLYEAITQIKAADVPISRFVVVDNGSTDTTPDYFRDKPGVQLIENSRNLGAATAWNQGITYALKNGASAILVCGNDTCPWPGTVERLWALVREGCLFVTGTAVPYGQMGGQVPMCPPDCRLLAAPDFSFMLISPLAIERIAQWDHEHDVSRRFWSKENGQALPTFFSPHQFGLADERFWPAYFEDSDWHLRAKKAGVPMLRDPGAYFRHDTSFTIRNNDDVGKQNREQTFARNADLFRSKWGGLPHEVDAVTAKPLNVTDEQWAQMSGGRIVEEINKADAVAQAQRIYQQYGVAATETKA